MLLSLVILVQDICHHWEHTLVGLFLNKLLKLSLKNISRWILFSIWMLRKLYQK
jgi:hypothetical protein